MKALFPFAETTRGITVRVSVSFLSEQSDPAKGHWFWAYHIRIENEGQMAAQLMTRRWEITDGRGAKSLVEGEGKNHPRPLHEGVEGRGLHYSCHRAVTGAVSENFGMATSKLDPSSATMP